MAAYAAHRFSDADNFCLCTGPGDEGSWMLNQVIARFRKFIRKARDGHGLHAPFRVTTRRGPYHADVSISRIGDRSRPIFGAGSLRSRPAWLADLEPTKKIAA